MRSPRRELPLQFIPPLFFLHICASHHSLRAYPPPLLAQDAVAILALLSTRAFAQWATTCATCAGASSSSGACFQIPQGPQGYCAWCPDNSAGPGPICYNPSSNAVTCFSNPVFSPQNCPATPTDITPATITGAVGQSAALAPSLGFLSLLVLCFLLLTNCEGLSGKPPASAPITPRTLHMILAAAVLLWFATGFLLAAPSVPWVYLKIDQSNFGFIQVYTGTMFNFYMCSSGGQSTGMPSPLCVSYPLATAAQLGPSTPAQLPNGGGTITLPIVASTAQSIAICCYVFSILLLLPAAILTSVSAYRLKLFLSHGKPTPTEGCAFIAFPAASVFAHLGLVCTIGTIAGAFNLAGPTISGVAPIYFPGPPQFNTTSIVGMPGPAFGALAIVCSLVACCLLLVPSCCIPALKTLPGFGTQCNITCITPGQPPQYPAQLQGATPYAASAAPQNSSIQFSTQGAVVVANTPMSSMPLGVMCVFYAVAVGFFVCGLVSDCPHHHLPSSRHRPFTLHPPQCKPWRRKAAAPRVENNDI